MADGPRNEEERVVLSGLAQETGRMLGVIVLQMVLLLVPVFVYGVVSAISSGLSLRTWMLVVGPIVSVAAIVLYPMAMYQGRSWLGAFLAWSGFLPYFFGLYVIGIEGIGRLLSLFSHFSIGLLIGSIFWIIIGWAFAYKLSHYTEAVKVSDQARKRLIERIREP